MKQTRTPPLAGSTSAFLSPAVLATRETAVRSGCVPRAPKAITIVTSRPAAERTTFGPQRWRRWVST